MILGKYRNRSAYLTPLGTKFMKDNLLIVKEQIEKIDRLGLALKVI